MQPTPWLWLFLLSSSCLAQSKSLVAGVANTGATTLTVISLPSSSPLPAAPSDAPTSQTTTSAPDPAASNGPAFHLQTTPYTGQDMLVGDCRTPQYTALALKGGAVLEVPLVGCSDDRPECCPSLSPPKSAIVTSPATFPASSITSPAATGVVPMLSASPLSVCPHDFVDLDPVCCPSGYRLYGQVVIGGITPCFSMLSTTATLPAAVSESIVSEAAMTASATATVSVIIDRIYALGLPCGDEPARGLSTGAKAGIGIGATVAGLLLLGLCIFIGVLLGKRRSRHANDHTDYYQPTQKNPMSAGDSYHSNDPNKPHSSWASQAPIVLPPVEMGTSLRNEIYEIGDSERAASPQSPGNTDMASIPETDRPTAHLPAYEARDEKFDQRLSY